MSALIYNATPKFGGWVTFTAHLAWKRGARVIYKTGERTETTTRPFGYAVDYQNISAEGARDALRNPLVAAADMKHLRELQIIAPKATVVVHDPNEAKAELADALKTAQHIITIRRSVQRWLKDTHGIESEFRPHPFYPYRPVEQAQRTGSVATSRIDFDKHTDQIIAANELLEARGKTPVAIYGYANRMYVHHKIGTERFERHYRGSFAKSFYEVSRILAGARFMVDMSAIKNDGGGTQYTFLEAAHNGSAIIVNRKWLDGLDESECEMKAGANCFAAGDAEELADILSKTTEGERQRVAETARTTLLQPHIETKW